MRALLVIPLVFVTSCSWVGRQADGMMDWANESMPTYDGSRPGAKQKTEIPVGDGSYYQPRGPVQPIPAPDQNGTMPHNFNGSAMPHTFNDPNMMQQYGTQPSIAAPAAPEMPPQIPQPQGYGQNPYAGPAPIPPNVPQPGAVLAPDDDFPEEYQNIRPVGIPEDPMAPQPMVPPPPGSSFAH